MPLLGTAAMFLAFDVDPESIDEHDDWHTHEHLPERLSIPGFLRGTRWISLGGAPGYIVLYEVAGLETLQSGAYLERLNNPSEWTSRMMPHYRGMRRGFCHVAGSLGPGTGHVAAVLRFKPAPGSADALRRWLLRDVLPSLPSVPGVGGVHLLESAAPPPMTREQRLRGEDAGVDWTLMLTGYRLEALSETVRDGFESARFAKRGALGLEKGLFRYDYSLIREEIEAART